jgi:hypothetical protein
MTPGVPATIEEIRHRAQEIFMERGGTLATNWMTGCARSWS